MSAVGHGPGQVTPHQLCEWFCEWFAPPCDRPAVAFVAHPVLGQVPTCRDCITRMGLADRIVSPPGEVVQP